ncbi:endonuclease/exonuclease/phosphatase family protein [Roseomonas sp. BN140053]|uniref:endonuclease/exonuclease/phosphatase family protein n=1 Tax=Roseomonas sp. BN140053 TaxID=3391898 RepID=UPI0039E9E80A
MSLLRTSLRDGSARFALRRLRAIRPAAEPASPAEARDAAGLVRVASYNVHKCVGRDGKFDPGRVAAVINEIGADVVAVQEADRRFGRRTGLLDAQLLRDEGGLCLVPVSDLHDGHGWHGNALLLRHGEAIRIRRLALPGAEPRGAVIAELALPAGKLRVVAAHFGLLRRCRARQGAAILHALRDGEPMPTLMMGDLNEWRPGRRSALRVMEPFFGPLPDGPPSFPTRRPVLALDRILGWPQGLVASVEVHDSPLARVASDHLPLTARVDLSPNGAVQLCRPADAA